MLQLPVQLQHELVHARDPLRRPSLQRGAQTPEHHDHVLHFDLLFLSVSFYYGAQDGRSPLGRSGRPVLDIPTRTFPDQETTPPGVFELLAEMLPSEDEQHIPARLESCVFPRCTSHLS